MFDASSEGSHVDEVVVRTLKNPHLGFVKLPVVLKDLLRVTRQAVLIPHPLDRPQVTLSVVHALVPVGTRPIPATLPFENFV